MADRKRTVGPSQRIADIPPVSVNTGLEGSLARIGQSFFGAGDYFQAKEDEAEAKAGEIQGGMAALNQSREVNGVKLPEYIEMPGDDAFAKAFNRQQGTIYRARLEQVFRDRATEYSVKFANDAKGMRDAMAAFTSSVASAVPEEFRPQMHVSSQALIEPFAKSAILARQRAHERDVERSLDLAEGAELNNAHLLAQKIPAGDAASVDAVNQLARILKSQADRTINSVDGVIVTPVQAQERLTKFQSALTSRFLMGVFDGTNDKEGMLKKFESGSMKIDVPIIGRDGEVVIQKGVSAIKMMNDADRSKVRQYMSVRAGANDRELREAVGGAISTLQSGRQAAGIDAILTRAIGTRYEKPLREAIADQQDMEVFNNKTIPEQTGEVRQISLAQTETPMQTRRRKAKTNALAANVRAAKADALSFGEAKGLYRLEPLSFDPVAIARRVSNARIAEEALGVPVSPFRAGEVKAVKDKLDQSSPTEALAIIGSLNAGLGDQRMREFADKLGAGSPLHGVALMRGQDAPEIALRILEGSQLVKGAKGLEITPRQIRDAVDNVYGDALRDVPSAVDAYAEAARALYAARRVPGGDLTYDNGEFEKALADVAGGVIEFNGRKIIAPQPNMEADEFESLVDTLTAADLVQFGNGRPMYSNGTEFGVEMLKARAFRTDAQFITVGQGVYRVLIPGQGYILSDRGGAYEIDMGGYINQGAVEDLER